MKPVQAPAPTREEHACQHPQRGSTRAMWDWLMDPGENPEVALPRAVDLLWARDGKQWEDWELQHSPRRHSSHGVPLPGCSYGNRPAAPTTTCSRHVQARDRGRATPVPRDRERTAPVPSDRGRLSAALAFAARGRLLAAPTSVSWGDQLTIAQGGQFAIVQGCLHNTTWGCLLIITQDFVVANSSSCAARNSGAGAQEKGAACYREWGRGEETTSTRNSCTTRGRSAATTAGVSRSEGSITTASAPITASVCSAAATAGVSHAENRCQRQCHFRSAPHLYKICCCWRSQPWRCQHCHCQHFCCQDCLCQRSQPVRCQHYRCQRGPCRLHILRRRQCATPLSAFPQPAGPLEEDLAPLSALSRQHCCSWAH
ncbi:UNVERIFIED_CONTAM: hypothetical protein FKN15_024476 [Acipenser sinensis]